jgi:hypothetical protein
MDRLVRAILRVWHIAERGESTVESEGNLAEELHSVERVKRMGGVLSSRPVSVPRASADNRIKQTVYRATSPEYRMYEGKVISYE